MIGQIKATVRERLDTLNPAAQAVQLSRLHELDAALTALVAMESQYIDAWEAGDDDGMGASVLKVRGSELLQAMTAFWRDALGLHGAAYEARLRKSGEGLGSAQPAVRAAAVNYNYLYARCWSIFGGSNEVQRNLIAAALLRS